jgi:hypothetical protein
MLMSSRARIGALLLLAIVADAAAAATVAAECGNVRILSDHLAASHAQSLCRYALDERQKVERYWGATFDEPIRIHVDPSYRIPRALVPAHLGNRGFMEMPLRRVLSGEAPLLHEIVHIYAPNGNRFLAEGLAVYLHHKLAGNRAFPNFGRALDREARSYQSRIESLEKLDRVRTPVPLGRVLDEQSAYILAGSFVGFLIEKYGLPAFHRLYADGAYESAYGKTLDDLEREWRSTLLEPARAK